MYIVYNQVSLLLFPVKNSSIIAISQLTKFQLTKTRHNNITSHIIVHLVITLSLIFSYYAVKIPFMSLACRGSVTRNTSNLKQIC